ncbi:conserved hypothetical protein [Trichinella spiralis]|uniref:hypothetical protein n=1 Tax=Trichinella spiralis TaxID=6334 RepID=UPI0001EFBC8A|nr:conserved hypothetical protein [Trichinella spiralis]
MTVSYETKAFSINLTITICVPRAWNEGSLEIMSKRNILYALAFCLVFVAYEVYGRNRCHGVNWMTWRWTPSHLTFSKALTECNGVGCRHILTDAKALCCDLDEWL